MIKMLKKINAWGDRVEAALLARKLAGLELYWWLLVILMAIGATVLLLIDSMAYEASTKPL